MRNRELGTPDGSVFPILGDGPFLAAAGYIEKASKGHPVVGNLGLNIVTLLGHVAIVQYENNNKKKNGPQVNRHGEA